MKRIVIIDDELDMAQTMAILLQDEGYKALAFADGEVGLAYMKEVLPHLVILDVMMPLVQGQDVVKAMKADQLLRSVPILLISASKEPVMKGDHWNRFLRKPFDIYELIAEVKELVK
ncbi:MAG TPA: response regulator [Bacteriovoracaceae bacterium]|nr:response regulator [Bacteriovoracaceae bacterium]